MKRVAALLLVLVFCFCTTQLVAQLRPIDPCPECDPPPPSCTNPNPFDNAFFFVQQQYRDFLFRDPTGAELANDVAPLNSCLNRGDFACYNTERVHMSRRMWDKPEFRQQSRTFGLPIHDAGQLYNTGDFVELSYLIYLQRSSSDPPDDHSRSGWVFWKNSLTNCLNGTGGNPDYISQCYNDIVNAFLSSTECRSRFGCP